MQIVYLNKRPNSSSSSIEAEKLELTYLKDIHKEYLKNKNELDDLGVTETEFVAKMLKALKINKGL